MRKFLAVSVFLIPFLLAGQPPCAPFGGVNASPPGDEPPGCLMCIGTVSFSNAGATPDTTIYESCLEQENSVWMAYIGDSTGTLSATFLASNCLTGDGLEMAIYDDSLNCLAVFDQSGAVTGNLQIGGLKPGRKYLIQMDGVNGDVCDGITVITRGAGPHMPPSVPFFDTSSPIDSICIGDTICYFARQVSSATRFEWNVQSNGHHIVSGGEESDSQICLVHEAIGDVHIQLIPSNECFPGVPIDTSVHVVMCSSSSSENNSLENHISIFPNPTEDHLTIETDLKVDLIEVYNLSGQKVKTGVLEEIDVSAYKSGVYILKIFTPGGVAIKKFIKN